MINKIKFFFSKFRNFLFQNEQSFMTFEGQQLQGAVKIMEKLQVKIRFVIFGEPSSDFHISFLFYFQSLTFQKINRVITAVDSQPMFDGGVLINVLGRLQVSKPHTCYLYIRSTKFQVASDFE